MPTSTNQLLADTSISISCGSSAGPAGRITTAVLPTRGGRAPDYPDPVSTERPGAQPYAPPELPPVNANVFHIVVPVTVLWFVVLIFLLFDIDGLRADGHLIWLWTAAAGTFLGGLGLSVYSWQRSASRRGVKSAQRM